MQKRTAIARYVLLAVLMIPAAHPAIGQEAPPATAPATPASAPTATAKAAAGKPAIEPTAKAQPATAPIATGKPATAPTATPQPASAQTATKQPATAPTTTVKPASAQTTTAQPAKPKPPAKPAVSRRQAQRLLDQGIADFNLGNYEEARDELTQARAGNPGSASAAYYLGATFRKMQRYDEALPQLQDAVRLQPPEKDAFVDLADTLYAMDRDDEALHALEVAENENIRPAQTAFLKGLVLEKEREHDEARASFEKAKAADPELAAAADYQIALIEVRRGNQVQAKAMLTAIADREPPDSDIGGMARQQAESITEAMKAKPTVHLGVGLQEQYDSNVVLKPDSTPVAVAHKGDMATIASVQAGYAGNLSPSRGLNLQYGFYQSQYRKLHDFDVQSHSLTVTPAYRMGENTANLQLGYNYTLVNKERYLSTISLSPRYLFVPREGRQTTVSLKYELNDYLQAPSLPSEDRDSTNVGASVAWLRLLNGQAGFTNIKYELNKENAKGRNWSYLGNRLTGGAVYRKYAPWTYSGGIDCYLQSFDNVHTVFNKKRQDLTLSLNGQAGYALGRFTELQLQAAAVKAKSTISVYTYTKYTLTLGVNARF